MTQQLLMTRRLEIQTHRRVHVNTLIPQIPTSRPPNLHAIVIPTGGATAVNFLTADGDQRKAAAAPSGDPATGADL